MSAPQKLDGNAAASAPLEKRVLAALADGGIDKGDLVSLLSDVEKAIADAEHVIATESARALELETESPDDCVLAIKKAELRIERLRKAVPKLEDKIQRLVAREVAASWARQFDSLKNERDALAKELSALYPPFVQNLANLFARIDALDARISALNAHAPHGEVRRLLETELKARSLDRFSAEQPPLRETLKLPDPGYTREVCFPPPVPMDAYYDAMRGAAAALARKHEATYSDHWYEAKKLRDQATREEIENRECELAEQRRQSERNFHDAVRREDAARCWPVSPEKETRK